MLPGPAWWTRWVALWLRCYPRDFRARFGADLAAQYPPPARGSAIAALRVALDLCRAGIGARRDARARVSWTSAAVAEIAAAWRGIRRRPAMFVAVGATLAAAASLTIAVFAIADAALLRPLPYPDDRQLVSIGNNWTGFAHSSVSMPEYDDYRQRARSFQAAALYSGASLNLAADGGPAERIQGTRVTASFFDVFQLPPQLGRPFTDEEQRTGAPGVVISHALWMRRFAGDPAIVGRALATDAGPRTIVGVMPAAFQFPGDDVDVWLPVAGIDRNRGAHTRQMVARLRGGVRVDQADAEMRQIAAALQREYPQSYPEGSGWSAGVLPLREILASDVDAAVTILSVAVAALMLLGCANVAGLLIARQLDRRHEWAVTVALGASRGRLRLRSLCEGALVGLISGIVGLVGAEWIYGALRHWLPDGVPHPRSLFVDARTLAFALVLTASAGALAALVGALRTGGVEAVETLRGTRGVTDAGTRRMRTVLAVTQVAAAVALLVAVGYAARSFARVLATDVGFVTSNVVTARVALSPVRYGTPAAQVAFLDRLQQALLQQPGVTAFAATSIAPLTGQINDSTFGIEHYVPATPGVLPNAQTRFVSDDYFRALGIPLESGRAFDLRDAADAPLVAIVSASLARRYFSDGDAVGRRITRFGRGTNQPWTTVIGIAGDIRHLSPMQAPEPILYYPLRQLPSGSLTLVARLDDAASDAAIRGSRVIADTVRTLDPEQPVWLSRTMDEWRSLATEDAKLTLALLAIFGVVAVTLASIGIFGVIAHGVARRRREFGVRLALGAVPARLVVDVVGRGLLMASAGIAAGLVIARATGRALTPVFPDVEVRDPSIWIGVSALVVIVTLAAAFVPARRAMRVNPIETLRGEG